MLSFRPVIRKFLYGSCNFLDMIWSQLAQETYI